MIKEYHVYDLRVAMFVSLLALYAPATSKVNPRMGTELSCLYCAFQLEDQAVGTVAPYHTQYHYSETDQTSWCPITWLLSGG